MGAEKRKRTKLPVDKPDRARRGPLGAGEDFLIPATIPTGGEAGDPKTHFSAKESRLWIKGQTQTDAGLVKGHLEMDFQLSGQGNERVSGVRDAVYARSLSVAGW